VRGRNRRVRRRPPLLPALARRLIPTLRIARRLALPALGTLVLASAGLACFRYVATGPYFRLHHLDVAGLERVSEVELMQVAGLTMGVTSTLELDPEGVRAALEAHPWVGQARVERLLPNRMRVALTERKATALVLLDRPMLSDAFGHLFAVPRRAGDYDYPIVTGLDAAALRNDDETERRRLLTALAAVREWTRQGLDELDTLSEVRPDAVLGLELVTTRDGTTVRIGHDALAGRIARLRSVLARVKARGRRAEYVLLDDEREPGRVAVLEVEDTAERAGTQTARTEIARRSDGTQG